MRPRDWRTAPYLHVADIRGTSAYRRRVPFFVASAELGTQDASGTYVSNSLDAYSVFLDSDHNLKPAPIPSHFEKPIWSKTLTGNLSDLPLLSVATASANPASR